MEGLATEAILAALERGRRAAFPNRAIQVSEERCVPRAFLITQPADVQLFEETGMWLGVYFPQNHEIEYHIQFCPYEDYTGAPAIWPLEDIRQVNVRAVDMTMRRARLRKQACTASTLAMLCSFPSRAWRDLRVLVAQELWKTRAAPEWDK